MVSGFCCRCAGCAARPLTESARRREERRLESPPVDPVSVVDEVVPLEGPVRHRRRLRRRQAEGAAGETHVQGDHVGRALRLG